MSPINMLNDIDYLKYRIKTDTEYLQKIDAEISSAENLLSSKKLFRESFNKNINALKEELKIKGGPTDEGG